MTAASEPPSRGRTGIDGTLLARMIGRAGDPATIRRKSADLAGAMCEPLQSALEQTAGFAVAVSVQAVELGLRSALEAGIAAADVRCPAEVRDWCHRLVMSVSAPMAIVFAESLLGGSGASPGERQPSPVELDVSAILFEQLLAVLTRVAGVPGTAATAGVPAVAAPDGEDDLPDDHSVMLTLQVAVGDVAAPLRLLLPQETVLKTDVVLGEPAPRAPADRSAEWTRSLSMQVRRSDVALEASIRLMPMTIGALARLRPGDVLPFADGHDVEVRLDANGRELARCELGRSGSRYMLRLKPAESLGSELMRDLP